MSEISEDSMRIAELIEGDPSHVFNAGEVCGELGISQERYVRAVNFLESRNAIGAVRTFGSRAPSMHRGPELESWLESEMEKYMTVTEDAKEIARRLSEWGPDGERVRYPHEKLGWPRERYLGAARELRDLGLVEDARVGDQEWALSSIRITQLGRSAVRSSFRRDVTPPIPDVESSLSASPLDFPELAPFLHAFRKHHPDPKRCAFLMTEYGETPLHERITRVIRDTCSRYGITALRADDKRYSDDLLPNVRTYMHGCNSGIAVIERLTEDDFNPNVSLEVGYMMAQGKPVCLLKDSTLPLLQTDLLGRLYDPFDTQDPENTIPAVLEKWFRDKGIVE